ncbi:MAG: DUF1631 family protein [Halioglobus sp.]
MGLPYSNDHLEAYQLKLNARHFPLSCSLQELVLKRYIDKSGVAGNPPAMAENELLRYIKNTDNFGLTPLESILLQAEALGDPALPTPGQAAVLQWLGVALRSWEQHFPLEEPLASQVRPLQSLTAALALTDPEFLVPGAHPMHQLLDTLQASAIGWQPQLGRAAKSLERQVASMVGTALTWFDNQNIDLSALSTELATVAERDQDRASRMSQRVIETEQGRLKTADVKRQAAQMINSALEKFSAPVSVGDFLKGPWYTSAQLVLLKSGADSDAWALMSATTDTLLDSLQAPTEDQAEDRRQLIFAAVTQIPKDIRKLLLSLQHDNEAVDDAVGLIEFAHLRILRQQTLELEKISLIAVDTEKVNAAPDDFEAMDRIKPGQWFRITTGPQEILRVHLILKMEHEQQLLFTNQAGVKALQLAYQEFADLLAADNVVRLRSGASFSACLAAAAGIKSTEQVEVLSNAAAQHSQREQQLAATLIDEPAELQPDQLSSLHDVVTGDDFQNTVSESVTVDFAAMGMAAMESAAVEPAPMESAAVVPAPVKSSTTEPAAAEPTAANTIDHVGVASTFKQSAANEPVPEALQRKALDLPMGAWLGFHDGDTPLMAKLAVHDRKRDNYIFVNREGIKMRELSKRMLLKLMDDGLVDILQTSSNFRDKVTLARTQLDE